MRFGAQEFASTGGVAGTMSARLALVLPVAALGAMVVVIGRRPLANYLGIPPAGVWLLLSHFVTICALSLVGAIFQARRQMGRYGVCLLLDKAAMLLSVLVLPAAWARQPMLVLAGYAVCSASVAFWGAATIGRQVLSPVRLGHSAFREMALFSAPLFLTSWAGFFGSSWFDVVILKRYVPLPDLGLYSLAVQLAASRSRWR